VTLKMRLTCSHLLPKSMSMIVAMPRKVVHTIPTFSPCLVHTFLTSHQCNFRPTIRLAARAIRLARIIVSRFLPDHIMDRITVTDRIMDRIMDRITADLTVLLIILITDRITVVLTITPIGDIAMGIIALRSKSPVKK